MDTDCGGSLVCLYSHSLPSFLHYISPNHYMAYTCGKRIEFVFSEYCM